MRHLSAILLVGLVVLSLPATAAVAVAGPSATDAGRVSEASVPAPVAADERTPPAVAAAAAGADGSVIQQSLALQQRPDSPGEFAVEASFAIPDAVVGLEVGLPDDAAVEATDGFEPAGDEYTWTGGTDEPSLTFRLAANESRREGGHGAVDGTASVAGHVGSAGSFDGSTGGAGSEGSFDGFQNGYDFVETGEWGIVAVPSLRLTWTHERGSSIGVERSVAVDGPGAAGSTIAVFGPVAEYAAAADGETFRLVVPEAASLAESPDDILDALADASGALPVGAANDEFFVVAAPTGDVEWRASGLQYGADDAWVRDDARLDRPGNVWFHEYVHSRQPFGGRSDGTTDGTAWLVEGQAEYYAGLLSLELGLVEYDDFRRFLERGQRSPYDRGVLAAPDTWADPETAYARGPLALAAIDREIRLATDGDRTLAAVFRDLNRGDRPLERRAVRDAVERAGGAEALAAVERYVEADEIPRTWSRHAHRTAFDAEATAHAYAFADEPIAVAGAYRNATVDAPDAVVPDETASIPVTVENVDDRTGTYDAYLLVDGDVVDERRGELAPGERATVRLEWTPEAPGAYELRIGDERRAVEIDAPAAATVADVSVSPRTAAVGEPVTATVTVVGHDERPALAEVTVTTPDGVVDERTVRLGPGETGAYETSFAFDREGRNEVAAGGASTVVGVGTIAGYVVRAEVALASIPTAGLVLGVGGLVGLIAFGFRLRRSG